MDLECVHDVIVVSAWVRADPVKVQFHMGSVVAAWQKYGSGSGDGKNRACRKYEGSALQSHRCSMEQ